MNRGLRAVLLVVAIAVTLAIHLKTKRLESPSLNTMVAGPEEREESSSLLGRTAPEFALPNLDGSTLALADLRGETVVLNFFATWCGPCRMEMPDLSRFSTSARARGIRVVGIDVQEPPTVVREFVASMALAFPVLLDEDGAASEAYGVEAFPTTLLIDPSGAVVAVQVGMIENFDEWYAEASRTSTAPPDRT